MAVEGGSDEAERIAIEYARRAEQIPADRYDAANPAPLFIRHGIDRALTAALGQAGLLPLAGKRIADIGCGEGQWLADLETFGAERAFLAGVDLLPHRVEAARRRLAGADIRLGDASSLPWADGSFDVVLQSMVRVLDDRGCVLSYDFFVDNPRNKRVRGISRSEVASLFPGFEVRWRRVTLAPPLVRMLAPRAWALASVLQSMKLANTHALAVLRRVEH